jgi:ATP/maltotriose-dependent transcriptional regulator MalT
MEGWMSVAVRGSFSSSDLGVEQFAHLLAGGEQPGLRVVGVADPSDDLRTRALDQCTALAGAHGVPLIRGRASGTDYGVFADAFSRVADPSFSECGQDEFLLLRGLFRSLGRPGWAHDALGVPDESHHKLHRAVCAIFSSLAGSDGVVLVLDDVHLADDRSLTLLEHLVRRGQVVLVLAYDPRLSPPRLVDLHHVERIAPVVELHRLTQRETTVLAVLAEGLTADAIARRLDISPRTVHRHLQHLYRKLGTTDRLATVLRAKTLGLLP